jgi:hypothetical protein
MEVLLGRVIDPVEPAKKPAKMKKRRKITKKKTGDEEQGDEIFLSMGDDPAQTDTSGRKLRKKKIPIQPPK